MKKSFLIVLLMCMALTVRAQFTFRSIKEPEQGMNCGKIAFMFTYNYRYVEDVNHRPYFFVARSGRSKVAFLEFIAIPDRLYQCRTQETRRKQFPRKRESGMAIVP